MKNVQKLTMIVLFAGLFLGLSSLGSATSQLPVYPPNSEVGVYLECSSWGHYHCMCSQQIRDTVSECAAWGHYRCICPKLSTD